MHLKTVAFKGRIAVIPHGARQKVVLNVRRPHTRPSPNKTTGLKMITRTQTCFGQYPLHADLELGQQIQLPV